MFIGGDDPRTLGSRPTNEATKAIDAANTSDSTEANIMSTDTSGKILICCVTYVAVFQLRNIK